MFKFDFTPEDLSDKDEARPHAQSDAFEIDIDQESQSRALDSAASGPHDSDVDESMTDAVVDAFKEISLGTLVRARFEDRARLN